MALITFSGKTVIQTEINNSVLFIKNEIKEHLGLIDENYYLIRNGKRFTENCVTEECTIHIVPKLIGGKGGFGSMLRAIGAQIEKTTNREACRDLSGRRLRDINEEKRLKTWMTQQVEREQEAEDRKQKKLERLCQAPRHEFRDEDYEKERSVLTEKAEDALEQGLKASTSTSTSTTTKRKQPEEKAKAKKKKLWLGSEDELSSSSDVDSEDDNSNSKSKDSIEESDSKVEENSPEKTENKIEQNEDTEEVEENSSEKTENKIEQNEDTEEVEENSSEKTENKIEQNEDTEEVEENSSEKTENKIKQNEDTEEEEGKLAVISN